jgi:hypothetical protein
VAGFCEHGNEHSNFIKGEFIDWLSDCQLLENYFAPFSYFDTHNIIVSLPTSSVRNIVVS